MGKYSEWLKKQKPASETARYITPESNTENLENIARAKQERRESGHTYRDTVRNARQAAGDAGSTTRSGASSSIGLDVSRGRKADAPAAGARTASVRGRTALPDASSASYDFPADLASWSKGVRQSDGSNSAELVAGQKRLADYYRKNSPGMDRRTRSAAESILEQGTRMLQQKRQAAASWAAQYSKSLEEAQGSQDTGGNSSGSVLDRYGNASADSVKEFTEKAKARNWANQMRDKGAAIDYDRKMDSYDNLKNNADFKALSGIYEPSARDAITPSRFMQKPLTDHSTDIMPEKNLDRQVAKSMTQPFSETLDESYSGYMTNEEKGIYNYLYNKEGEEAAKEYLRALVTNSGVDSRHTTLEQRSSQKVKEAMQEMAEEHPVLSAAATVPMSVAKGVSSVGQMIDYAGNSRVNPDAWYNMMTVVPDTMRNTVVENIESPIGRIAASVGLSVADNLFQIAATGGFGAVNTAKNAAQTAATLGQKLGTVAGSLIAKGVPENAALLIMSSGAMSSSVIRNKESGMDDTRAMVLGIVAGAAEYVTEKVSLDTLLNPDVLKQGLLKSTLINAFTEGTEEVAADFINTAADAIYDGITMQDQSQWKRDIELYKSQNPGASDGEAFGYVLQNKLAEMGMSFIGGALAGGLMGGGMGAVNAPLLNAISRETDAVYDAKTVEERAENVREVVDAGLKADPGSDAYKGAEALKAKMDSGIEPSKAEVRAQIVDNQAEAQRQLGEARSTVMGRFAEAARKGGFPYTAKAVEEAYDGKTDPIEYVDAANRVFRTAAAAGTRLLEAAGDRQRGEDSALAMDYHAIAGEAMPQSAYDGTGPLSYGQALKIIKAAVLDLDSRQAEKEIARWNAANTNDSPVAEEDIPQFVEEAKELFGEAASSGAWSEDTAAAARESYVPGTDFDEWYTAVDLAEEAGRRGARFDETYLPEYVRPVYEAASEARENGFYNKQDNQEGHWNEGTGQQRKAAGVHDVGGGIHGQDSGGQGGGIRQGAGGTQEARRPGGQENAGGAYGARIQGKKLTARQLGLPGGTDEKQVEITSGKGVKGRRQIESEASALGLKVVYFKGGNLSFENAKNVRGAYYAGTVFVREDADVDAARLARHEFFHAKMSARGGREEREAAVGELWAQSTFLFGEGFLNTYILPAYRKVYEGSGLSDIQIKEEILADCHAGINIFDGVLERLPALKFAIESFYSKAKQTMDEIEEAEAEGTSAKAKPKGGAEEILEDIRGLSYDRFVDRYGTPKNGQDEWDGEGLPFYSISGTEKDEAKPSDGLDARYLELAKDPEGNREELQAMVDAEARRSGYTSPKLYHGSDRFGFTVINTSFSDDSISFFTSSSPEVAKSYTKEGEIREIESPKDILLLRFELAKTKFYKACKQIAAMINKNKKSGKIIDENDVDESIYVAKSKTKEEYKENFWNFAKEYYSDETGAAAVGKELSELRILSDKAASADWEIEEIMSDKEWNYDLMDIINSRKGGIYSYYAREDGMLEVHAKGAWWTEIPFELTVENPLTEKKTNYYSVSTRQIAKHALSKGYPGVIIRDVMDVGLYAKKRGIPSDVYVFFNPQDDVKSADPVTYDNDGNVIPLSERFNPENEDIRFSKGKTKEKNATAVSLPLRVEELEGQVADLKSRIAELQKENEENARGYAKYRREVQTTAQLYMEKDVALKVARRLVKAVGSKTDLDSLADDVQRIAGMIKGNEDFDKINAEAHKLAVQLVARAREKIETGMEDIQSDIRSRKLLVSENARNDIADYGAWRKSMFGKMNLSMKEGMPIEDFWSEMQLQYGEGLFSDDIKNPSDQLLALGEYASAKPGWGNPYEGSTVEATEWAAQQVMAEIIAAKTRPTFADKAEKKLDRELSKKDKEISRIRKQKDEAVRKVREQKDRKIEEITAENRERLRRMKREAKEDRDKRLKELNEKLKERERKAAERRTASDMRKSIERRCGQLSRKLLTNSNALHIPEDFKGTVLELLDSVNLSDSKEKAGRRTEAFNSLRAKYAKYRDMMVVDDDMLYRSDDDGNPLPGMLEEIASMRDKPIADMTLGELQKVYDAIRAVEASISSYDRLFSSEKYGRISEFAYGLVMDNLSAKAKLPYGNRMLESLRTLTMLDMLTPESFLGAFGKYGARMFKMMRAAQDAEIMHKAETKEFCGKELSSLSWNKLDKKKVDVRLGGRPVRLSLAELMDLYCLSTREQAMEHLETGGFQVRNVTYRHVTKDELEAAFNAHLTNDMRLACKKMVDYLSTTCSEWGNAATMQVYGYKRFNEPAYWPIRTAATELRMSEGINREVTSQANKGFTKSTVPNAKTAVIIGSAYMTFAKHANDMASYSAWLATAEDINRIRNYKAKGQDGVTEISVPEIINKIHGMHGTDYLQNLMTDLANANRSERDYTGGLFGNFKAAAVGANLRVIIQQPTAILRALSMISPKHLLKGMSPQHGWEEAVRYVPIARWKDWGYFDINTGPQSLELYFGSDSPGYKIRRASMWAAGKADSLAWGMLWNACKSETRERHPELQPGSDEFFEVVKKRFSDIIDHTQVVDGILQRSQIMRSKSTLNKMATAFMGEPMKIYNMFVSAIRDLLAGKPGAKKAAAAAFISLAVSGIVNAIAQSVVDALRDREDKPYLQKMFNALFWDPEEGASVKSVLGSNLAGNFNPAAFIPYVKDVASILQGYEIERTDMQAISDLVSTAQSFIKSLQGKGTYTTLINSLNMLNAGASAFGIPLSNLKRDVLAVADAIVKSSGDCLARYGFAKLEYNQATNKKKFTDLLIEAYQTDRDEYEAIRADLIREDKLKTDSQTTEEYIDSKMKPYFEADERHEAGVTDEEYAAYQASLAAQGVEGRPNQEEVFTALKSSGLSAADQKAIWDSYGYQTAYADFKTTETRQKEAAAKKAAAKAKADAEKKAKADAVGLSVSEYDTWDYCLKLSDADKNKYYKNSELEEAIRRMGGKYGWTQEQMSGFWLNNLQKSGKNNPFD